MNRGDASDPCPRCKGPTTVFDYDEAPWGARGNYSFECKTCGEFRDVARGIEAPTYIFRNDPAAPEIQMSDKALPAPVDVGISVMKGFEPGKFVEHFIGKRRRPLPTGLTFLSELFKKSK